MTTITITNTTLPYLTGGYITRPRALAPAAEAELAQLTVERGLGELLTVDGDRTGAAHVVVEAPRQHEHGFVTLDIDPARWPALAVACEHPAEPDDPLQGYLPDEIIVGPGGQTLAQAAAAEAQEPAPGWEDRAVERARDAGLFGARPDQA